MSLEYSTLPAVLRDAVGNDGGELEGVLFTTFALNVHALREIVRDAGIPEGLVVCVFQRFSFPPSDNPLRRAYTGELRRNLLADFDRAREFRLLRVNYMKKATQSHFRQFHVKMCLLKFADRLEFVQFSQNIDYGNARRQQMIYRGLPRRLECVLAMLSDALDKEDYLVPLRPQQDADAVEHAADIVQLFKLHLKEEDPPRDRNAYAVCQSFRTVMAEEIHRRLASVHGAAEGLHLYERYPVRDSVLLLHFPFVNHAYETNLCDAVAEHLSVSLEEQHHTRVELTYKPPAGFLDFPHESWACRLTGTHPSDRMLWFFLVSCNLTAPSWGPYAQNLEAGVLVFEQRDDGRRTVVPNAVRAHIAALASPSGNTSHVTATCGPPAKAAPLPAPRIKVSDNANFVTAAKYECVISSDYPDDYLKQTRDATASTWDRYRVAKETLVRSVLPGLTGAADLLNKKLFRYNYMVRWALYDYLFNDLAKGMPGTKVGAHDFHTVRRYFAHRVTSDMQPYMNVEAGDASIPHPWAKCAVANTTLEVLVDLYVRFAKAFDLYDANIMRERPKVTKNTLMSLADARPGEQFVEEPQQKARRPALSPYDTLSFLFQSTFSNGYTWFRCAKGHSFYWTVRHMMVRDPHCPVCAKYHDIQLLYDLLQDMGDVSLLTVEFPLLRNLDSERIVEVKTKRSNRNTAEEEEEEEDKEEEMDAARFRRILKYDLFFRYKKKYVCAVEFDDSSHNNTKQRMQILNNMTVPNADASKNVLSSAMGIHLLRVWVGLRGAGEYRPNAKGRLQAILEFFLERVENRDLELESNQSNFEDRWTFFEKYHKTQKKPNPKQNDKRGILPSTMRTNTSNEDRWKHDDELPLPVSLILSTDTPDFSHQGTSDSFFLDMHDRGSDHPLLRDGGRVIVPRQIDQETWSAYYLFLMEWSASSTASSAEGGLDLSSESLQGRVCGGFEDAYTRLGALRRVLGLSHKTTRRMSVEVEAQLLERKKVGPWQAIMPLEKKTVNGMGQIAELVVRLVEPGSRPPGQRLGFPNTYGKPDPPDRSQIRVRGLQDYFDRGTSQGMNRLNRRRLVRDEKERKKDEGDAPPDWAVSWIRRGTKIDYDPQKSYRTFGRTRPPLLKDATVLGIRQKEGTGIWVLDVRSGDGTAEYEIHGSDNYKNFFRFVTPAGEPNHETLYEALKKPAAVVQRQEQRVSKRKAKNVINNATDAILPRQPLRAAPDRPPNKKKPTTATAKQPATPPKTKRPPPRTPRARNEPWMPNISEADKAKARKKGSTTMLNDFNGIEWIMPGKKINFEKVNETVWNIDQPPGMKEAVVRRYNVSKDGRLEVGVEYKPPGMDAPLMFWIQSQYFDKVTPLDDPSTNLKKAYNAALGAQQNRSKRTRKPKPLANDFTT